MMGQEKRCWTYCISMCWMQLFRSSKARSVTHTWNALKKKIKMHKWKQRNSHLPSLQRWILTSSGQGQQLCKSPVFLLFSCKTTLQFWCVLCDSPQINLYWKTSAFHFTFSFPAQCHAPCSSTDVLNVVLTLSALSFCVRELPEILIHMSAQPYAYYDLFVPETSENDWETGSFTLRGVGLGGGEVARCLPCVLPFSMWKAALKLCLH